MSKSAIVEDEATRASRVTVLLVESSAVLRERLLRLLGAIPGVTLIETASAPGALASLASRHTDVVLVDIDLPGWTDLGQLAQIRRAMGSATLIVLASDASPESVSFCRGVGADFFFHTHSEFYRIGDVLLHLLTQLTAPSA